MENVQKWPLRNVYEDYESSYDELLLKSKLATLEVQRYRFIATEVYKAVNKLTPIYPRTLWGQTPGLQLKRSNKDKSS